MRTEEIVYSPRPFLNHQHLVLLEMGIVSKSIHSLPQYNLYVGNNTKRIFLPSSLPSFIQLKLAMINSIPKEDWNLFRHDETFLEIDCYIYHRYTKNNPEFKHIGWCVSDSIYVIVMSEDELSELKGISIDPRKESQRESQTHTQRT
tara:strand:+ start:181 stop:621 length:441 start_codon:yes stop_codon:yes gene_type:complete